MFLILCSRRCRRAATWLTAGFFGFVGSHESAEELLVHLRSDCIHVHSGLSKKVARILDVVDTRWLDRGILESSTFQLRQVLALFQGSGDTADPKQHAFAHLFRHSSANHHVGDGETPIGPEHAERLTENPIFVYG